MSNFIPHTCVFRVITGSNPTGDANVIGAVSGAWSASIPRQVEANPKPPTPWLLSLSPK